MKTFADFLTEAKTRKSNYAKVYAAKVAAERERQQKYVQSHKDRIKQNLQKHQEAEARRKEEEEENKEYIKHIDNLKSEIRDKVKKEYGIRD
jgi:hypothetical protein